MKIEQGFNPEVLPKEEVVKEKDIINPETLPKSLEKEKPNEEKYSQAEQSDLSEVKAAAAAKDAEKIEELKNGSEEKTKVKFENAKNEILQAGFKIESAAQFAEIIGRMEVNFFGKVKNLEEFERNKQFLIDCIQKANDFFGANEQGVTPLGLPSIYELKKAQNPKEVAAVLAKTSDMRVMGNALSRAASSISLKEEKGKGQDLAKNEILQAGFKIESAAQFAEIIGRMEVNFFGKVKNLEEFERNKQFLIDCIQKANDFFGANEQGVTPLGLPSIYELKKAQNPKEVAAVLAKTSDMRVMGNALSRAASSISLKEEKRS